MPLHKTPAIILNHKDFGESDKIITLFTYSLGKITSIAKGAKRSRKRFANQLDLFSLVRPILWEKQHSSLTRIDQCDLLQPFASIRKVPERFAYAAYFCELVDAWVKDRDPHAELFHLLLWTLRMVDQGASLAPLSVIFHLRLLSIVGYAPNFIACVNCNLWKGGQVSYGFNYEKGGIVCSDCAFNLPLKNRLSPGTVKLLSLAQKTSLAKLSRLHFSAQLLAESAPILENFVHSLLGKEIKSYRFLSGAQECIR